MKKNNKIIKKSAIKFTKQEKKEIELFCNHNNMPILEYLRKSAIYCLENKIFQKEMRRIGDFLLEDNVITKEQLNDALKKQAKSGELLGSILIKSNLIDDETLSRYLACQVLEW